MSFVAPKRWYAGLPKTLAAAGAFISGPGGTVLLVKPNYRAHWTFPGGMLDPGEVPHSACVRDVEEELGVSVTVGDLLVVDWAPPAGARPFPIVYFLFDCGGLSDLSGVTVQSDELDDVGFFSVGDALVRLPVNQASRVSAAGAARAAGVPVYLPASGWLGR